MLQQPSPQGIASLYMGNPGALQQKVQKEQQAKPGLPPDLKNLMALNIVTNEQDAAKRQSAMNALNSMAPAGQEPPTIAQSIQAQAKQKMQAQMLQQQRQQMAMQEMAKQQGLGGIPDNTPQPERQPQGIDELPVEMGLAGGGIVAFGVGDSVPRVNAPVGNPQAEFIEFLEKMGVNPKEFTQSAPQVQNELRDMYRATSGAAQAAAPTAQAAQVAEAAAPVAETAATKASGLRGLLGKVAPMLGRVAGWAPTAMYSSDLNVNEDDQLKKRDMYGKLYGAGDAPATIKDLLRDPNISAKQFAERAAAWFAQNPKQMPAGAPEVPPVPDRAKPPATSGGIGAKAGSRTRAPVAAVQPAPEQPDTLKGAYTKYLERQMSADPDAAAAAATKRHKEMVGESDLSQYDRLIAELEGRKQQLNAPKAGWDAFTELAANIAAQGPQRHWYEAGARGAAAQRAMDKERQAQQFELTKQGVDVAQKKRDAEMAYKEKLFGIDAKTRDDIEKQVAAAAKEYGLDERKKDELRNHLEGIALQGKYNLAAANVRAEAAGGENAMTAKAEAAFARDPDAQAQRKILEAFAFAPDSPNALRARERLAEIRASKYREFGITLEGAPGAPQSPGGSTPPPGAVREVKR